MYGRIAVGGLGAPGETITTIARSSPSTAERREFGNHVGHLSFTYARAQVANVCSVVVHCTGLPVDSLKRSPRSTALTRCARNVSAKCFLPNARLCSRRPTFQRTM